MAMEYGYGPPTELAAIIIEKRKKKKEKRKKKRKKQELGPGWRVNASSTGSRRYDIFRSGLG